MGYQLHPCYSSFIAFGAKISLESITPTSPPLSGSSLLVYVLAIPTLIFPFVQFPLGMYPTKLSLVLFRSFVPLHQREKKYERKIHDTSKNCRNSHKGVDSILPLISQYYSYLNILLFSKYMIFIREIIFLLSKNLLN